MDIALSREARGQRYGDRIFRNPGFTRSLTPEERHYGPEPPQCRDLHGCACAL
jgi:hypothetical protein